MSLSQQGEQGAMWGGKLRGRDSESSPELSHNGIHFEPEEECMESVEQGQQEEDLIIVPESAARLISK